MEVYSPIWMLVFVFQVLLCFFGLLSQYVFMRTTVFDAKVSYYGRFHLFCLSVGYQLILITFLLMTGICLRYGTMFEVAECAEDRMIPLKFHNLGEFLVVVFHMLINLDRLILAFRPKEEKKCAKIWFFFTLFFTCALSFVYVELAHHEDFRKSIAFGTICLVNVFNLLIESKLFYYTSVVYVNTIGQVPLERRFELSSSVSMIRCFLPASACGLVFKFTVVTFYSLSYLLRDPTDIPPYYFVLNVFWNLDCALFPWFFILFHPTKKQKLMRFLKLDPSQESSSLNETLQKSRRLQMQNDHFNHMRNVWKVGV